MMCRGVCTAPHRSFIAPHRSFIAWWGCGALQSLCFTARRQHLFDGVNLQPTSSCTDHQVLPLTAHPVGAGTHIAIRIRAGIEGVVVTKAPNSAQVSLVDQLYHNAPWVFVALPPNVCR